MKKAFGVVGEQQTLMHTMAAGHKSHQNVVGLGDYNVRRHYQVLVSYVPAASLSLTAPPSGISPENTSG